MPRTFDELAFTPSVSDLLEQQAGQRATVLTGRNNSGKSAYLKKMALDRSKLYIGVNRFYSFHHLSLHSRNDRELDDMHNNLLSSSRSQYSNFEGSFFNTNQAITRLTDARREVLFDTFRELFSSSISVQPEIEGNVFSNRYINVDGESLSVTSSGTRLFLGVLAALMDERFTFVALDEPELGLSPPLQRKLSNIILDGEYHSRLFPHKPHFVLSTHSHAFLDKITPTNNFVVSRNSNLISARRCKGFSELNDIQFNMLGNDLGSLFLPDAVILVEGESDKLFLRKVVSTHIPRARIVIESCGGDIARRLSYWSALLGDMQTSPYRGRTFLIYDSVEQAGLERAAINAGIPQSSLVKWDGNGIEYVYPIDILSSIFRTSITSQDELNISGDRVSAGGITYTKMELAGLVSDLLTSSTQLSEEMVSKFLGPLTAALTGE